MPGNKKPLEWKEDHGTHAVRIAGFPLTVTPRRVGAVVLYSVAFYSVELKTLIHDLEDAKTAALALARRTLLEALEALP